MLRLPARAQTNGRDSTAGGADGGVLSSRGRDAICLLAIILVTTAFLAPALRPGFTLLPLQHVSRLLPWSEYIDAPMQNRVIGDPFFAFYPRRLFFTEAIRNGELPFWNPYVLGGYPAVGDTNSQTFYPFNWVAALLVSPARSFALLAWFHLSLTGAFMFAMLRSHRLRRISSLLGAVTWMLSAIMVVWLEHPHRLSSFAWLPGVFWLFKLGLERRRFLFSVLAGLLLALMFLGGQPQYAGLGGLLLAAYALACSVGPAGDQRQWRWWPLASLVIVAVIGVGVGSLQLLPTYEFVSQSHRQTRDIEVWFRQTLPLGQLGTLWMPDFYGSADATRYRYWGPLNQVEYAFYYGAIPFLLSLIAPFVSQKKRLAWLWGAIVVATILVAIGSPLTHLAKLVPGMSYFSLHRMMSHIPFLGSWLAALALDGLARRPRAAWPIIGLVVAVMATGGLLYNFRLDIQTHWAGIGPHLLRQGMVLAAGAICLLLLARRHRLALVAVLLLSGGEMFTWGFTFNAVSDLDLLYPKNEITDRLLQDKGLYRVLALRHDQPIFGENVLSVFHIGAPDGYLAMTLRTHKELMYTIDPYYEDERRRFVGPHINLIVVQDWDRRFSLLNVKYVLSTQPQEAPELGLLATLQGVHIYENLDVLPRAYPVHRARGVPEDQVLQTVMSPDWDYHTEVILSDPLPAVAQGALAHAPVVDSSTVKVIDYDSNQVQLAADMEHAGLLVLADPYCLGWRASVDGEPAEILRANAHAPCPLSGGGHTFDRYGVLSDVGHSRHHDCGVFRRTWAHPRHLGSTHQLMVGPPGRTAPFPRRGNGRRPPRWRPALTAVEFRLMVVLAAMVLIPGWALLSLWQGWRQWNGLQRWIVAIGLGVAFYPVLFYAARALPLLTIGPFKTGALLVALAALAGWQLRRDWRTLFQFDRLEWVALALIAMTLFSRFWIIRDRPYPAWSDSLHHTLLTQLTAEQGRLPGSLEPFFPVPLEQYHLGLYALSGTVASLAQAPAHTALLWTAQLLNGLCGLGVYLVLDRRSGRRAAIVGALVAGLLSHQPGFYVNWGRFTQLASQVLMLVAWSVTWEAVAAWRTGGNQAAVRWQVSLAAVLNGAVFLLHFRVAAFYLPLLGISLLWELWQARRGNQLGRLAAAVVAVGVLTLLAILPALVGALSSHVKGAINLSADGQEVVTAAGIQETLDRYHDLNWSAVPLLAAHNWLLALAGVSALWGLLRRNKLVLAALAWMGALALLGSAYRLGAQVINITNMGAVLILWYLPISLIVGAAAEELLKSLSNSRWREMATRVMIGVVLASGFVFSHVRAADVEPMRYFVTPQDVAAMEWIRANTPPDALLAINTFFWLPYAPHGTDAGYWIPYLTGRQITAGVMLISLEIDSYQPAVVKLSQAEEKLETDNAAVGELQALGVDYIYIGRMGDFSGPGLNAARLKESPLLTLVYERAGVFVFQVNPVTGQ